MSNITSQFLSALDALPAVDRQAVTAALLRRVLDEAPAELSDEGLIAAAEELFLELDQREQSDAAS